MGPGSVELHGGYSEYADTLLWLAFVGIQLILYHVQRDFQSQYAREQKFDS